MSGVRKRGILQAAAAASWLAAMPAAGLAVEGTSCPRLDGKAQRALDLFDGSPEGAFSLNLVWSRAIGAGRAYGVRMDGVWMHVGTPAALAEAEQYLSGAQQV